MKVEVGLISAKTIGIYWLPAFFYLVYILEKCLF